jgi:GNAT superfamily N-acetyltransferase
MTGVMTIPGITVLPATQARWTDLDAVLGSARCHGVRCYSQRYQVHGLRSSMPTGLVAYLDGQPVGWCSVLPRRPVPWAGRDDDPVWALTCFIIRPGYRRRQISHALACGAVDLARRRGATAIEGYPVMAQPGFDIRCGELHAGSRSTFMAAGFSQVSRPTVRRAVMRMDLAVRPSTSVY